ncbi:hypothetical protein [Amphritea pacifica]|uniref:Uncharacterized protein n=1 Tax=Amphritea pacifica TaxID=2811233 RepID=A0ABS2WCB8_9GAMM|nr:hypothetical protein [Amphritea pacifica]MBN0989356.1 hypothetical protein [Amphritea pacifica]
MKHNSIITADEIRLLKKVRQGDFDNVSLMPSELQPLITRGLVESIRSITLPIMPTRFRYRLTLAGEKVLSATTQPLKKR